MPSSKDHQIWKYPTKIHFGVGVSASLEAACRDIGSVNPLIVTDQAMASRPLYHQFIKHMRTTDVNYREFNAIKPNPTGENVQIGVESFQAGQHDGILAFGGGSALDAAKAIAFQSAQQDPFFSFIARENRQKALTETVPPLLAIPTTAGTGAEASYASVILEEETKRKRILAHPVIMPRLALCDPSLTLDVSPEMTAATAFDAIAHSLEAYCVADFHPMADGIALQALLLLKEALPLAYQDGQNLQARSDLMAASIMGAAAFQKGLGATHALSHAISARIDSHHGLTNAVLLPYVLRFNKAQIADKMTHLAQVLALDCQNGDGFAAVQSWLLGLRRAVKIPETLAALGVDMRQADAIAQDALKDPMAEDNPTPLTEAKLWALLEAAYDGRLG